MMEDEGDHTKEVFAHYGLALYLAQCLEHGIVNALMQLDLFAVRAEEIRKQEQPPQTRDECYKIFETYDAEQFEKTMGNLIKKLHLLAQVPDQNRHDPSYLEEAARFPRASLLPRTCG